MATTYIDICNRSLIRLGAETITGFDDGDKGTTCSVIYNALRDALLVMRAWRFTMQKVQLSRLVAAPENEWTYAFQLPTDMLAGPRAVFDSDDVGAQPFTEFEIFGDKLFADATEIYVDYQVTVTESKMPPWFAELLVLAMCAAIGPNITDNKGIAAEYHARAYGPPSDNMRGGWFAICAGIDAAHNPPNVIEDDSLIVTR